VRVKVSGQKVYVEIVMIKRRGKVGALRMLFLAAFLVLGLSSVSQAGPLGVLDIGPGPEVDSGFITTTYNATTGAFSANGWALTLDTQNLAPATTFKLNATINKLGVASAAWLTIGSAAAPMLYSATLMDFKYDAVVGGAMEFLFGPATGSYAGIYSDTKSLDVILTPGTGFKGTFATGFTSSSGTAALRGESPTQATPEPSALLLMMVAGAGLLGATTHAQRSRRGLAAVRLS